MTFERDGVVFNLLDTPGHEDFSEDTYRTLTAVDAAVMVLDAAKGIEAQTRKLFEVCRLRDIPIITFVNKMDREGRDPFDLLDEIEKTLALDAAPVSWPIGQGADLRGVYDILRPSLRMLDSDEVIPLSGLDDPALDSHVPAALAETLREQAALAAGACAEFDLSRFLEGYAHAGVLRLGAARFRRGPPAGRPGALCPAAAPAPGRWPHGAPGGSPPVGLRVQDPGEHGPAAPRPRGLPAHLLGPAGEGACA